MHYLISLIFWSALAANGAERVCAEIQTRCTDGPREAVMDGMRIHRPCWQRTTEYACVAPNVSDTCGALRERGCTEQSASCLEHATVAGTSLCMTEQREYSCRTGGGESTTVADCAGQQYCIEGNCFDTGSSPDDDFKQAVTALEATRQAGVYLDQDTLQVFRGEDRRCSKTVVRNCCKVGRDAAAFSNSASHYSSTHAFDAPGGESTPAVASRGLQSQALFNLRDAEASLFRCSREEDLIALQRGKQLCHYVGEYCSRHISLGFARLCIERKESYCCFNSKIARLIAEAARQQLPGMTWGSPDRPSCQGLTVEQFQSVDLSRVDFSEIYDDIKPASPDGRRVLDSLPRLRSYFDHR